jgi:predicted DNA-binding protein
VSRKKLSTTVYLERYQVLALQHLTARTGVPAAKMVRDAIDVYLAKQVDLGLLVQADLEGEPMDAPRGFVSEERVARMLKDAVESALNARAVLTGRSES